MRYLLLVLALAIPSLAMAQSVAPVASLDRSTIGLGETVTLNIEVGDQSADEPDLSPLSADFTILGTSTNHSLSIVNGRREAHTILGVALRPRREGHLTIPALRIGGQQTQPVSLEVATSSDNNASAADRPVVLLGWGEGHGYLDPNTAPELRCFEDLDLFAAETPSDLEVLEQDVFHILIETPTDRVQR